MNKFNDRVYLLLTLKEKELLEYYLQTIIVIVAIAAYNLIGVFINTPIVINYFSLIVAFVLISILFAYLKSQALPIDWELLEEVEKEINKVPLQPKETVSTSLVKEEEEPEMEVSSSNEEIQMVEDDEDEFDFSDMLTSLYKTGTPKQLSDVTVNGIEQKVRRMNLR